MRAICAALLGALTLILPASILAQSPTSVTAIIQADGTYKALVEDQSILDVQFWQFKENWVRVTDWQESGNGTTTFSRIGQLGPGTITAATQFTNISGGTTLNFQATPSRTVESNSDHINLMFDDAFWAGATVAYSNQSFQFNSNFTQGFLRTGRTNSMTVTRPDGFRVTISAPTPVNFVAQDSRAAHMGFELRFDEQTGSWSAGTTRNYSVTLKFSVSTSCAPDSPVTINESNDWRPLLQSMTVQPGSALDWSNKFVQPAGSQGWLKVNSSGRFAFANSLATPQRFYGVNLTHYMCFPEHSQAIPLADGLAAAGYNTVRLHHIDKILTDAFAANSTTLNAAMMDKLNYFISKLKERGFYVSIDLYSLRKQRDNEVISGSISENDYKALLLVSPTARQNWLNYASNLLNTMNPYTGLRWKDEPAIAWMCLVNENTPFWLQYPRSDIKGMLDSAVGGDWANMSGAGARNAVELTRQTSVWMATQLRALGVKSLISNLNAGFNRALSIGRSDLDYVDNHLYYAHPSSYSTPFTQKSTSPLRKIEEQGWFAASRIKGKPFTVSEFDAVAPNQFRAEFGLMAGAMGVVQQWDGMWRFQWSDNPNRALSVAPMALFSLTSDPLSMATERAIVAMFLRGDLTNSDFPNVIPNLLASADEQEIREEPVVKQSILATPISQDVYGGRSGGLVVTDGNSSTSTGSVSANLKDLSFKVKTTSTAGVIGSQGQTVNSGPIAAKFTKSRATIYVTAVDRRPLASSRRMLLAHLTDVQNTGTMFSGKERSELVNWGGLPHLAKLGTAEVTLQVQTPSIMRIYRLDQSGRRLGTVPFTKLAKAIRFNVSTRDPLSGMAVLYYEIVTTK